MYGERAELTMDFSKLDGLIPAVVQDHVTREVLMVGFMNEAALAVWRKGHVPVIGVNMALPVIAAAGGGAAADAEIMMPLSLALAERCDAFLRIGGASVGADQEMARFTAAGKRVFRSVDEID